MPERSLIRYPIPVGEALAKIHAAAERVYKECGDAMHIPKIAQHLNMDVQEVNKVLSLGHSIVSADKPWSSDDSSTLLDTLTSEDTVEFGGETQQREALVEQLLNVLNKKERLVIRQRFGIGLSRSYTLQEISDQFGLTRERIRQIEIGAMAKIKERFYLNSGAG